MRELGGDANCVTDLQTDRRTQPFIVKDFEVKPNFVFDGDRFMMIRNSLNHVTGGMRGNSLSIEKIYE